MKTNSKVFKQHEKKEKKRMICINFDPKTLKSIKKTRNVLNKIWKKYKDIISINLNENKLKSF